MKNNQAVYQKWLRYYLDFCRKYNFPQTQCGSLTHFLVKLQEKKQTKAQQDQASNSISLYYELILARDTLFNVPSLPKAGFSEKPDVKEKVFSKPLAGVSWRAEYTELANEIRARLLKKQKVLLIFRRFFTRPESGFGLSMNPLASFVFLLVNRFDDFR